MIATILGLFLISLALGALALQRLYSSVPARELKRLAARDDQLARALYRPVAYGASLRLLLWLVLGFALPAGFVLIAGQLPPLVSFAVLAVVSFVAFVWLPSLQLTRHSVSAAAWFAPAVTWILQHTHVVLDPVSTFGSRHRDLTPHSRMYEKEDLLALLERQKDQVDNRVLTEELELAQRALVFNDRHAEDVATPRKEAHLVNAEDSIGPVLLDQLHKQNQTSFLVYKDTKENIVGSLAMSDAVTAKQGGRVFDLVRSDLTFVHEDFTLQQVLAVFQKTGQQLVAVINKFEEFTGLVTLGGLLQELLGEPSQNDTIPYENRSAVAAYQPQKEKTAEATEVDTETKPSDQTGKSEASPEATEVVE